MWLEPMNDARRLHWVDEGSRANLALARWCGRPTKKNVVPSSLVFAAHPDDDVLGVGARLLTHGERAAVAYLSDGAPLNPRFFREAGFQSRTEYAAARRRE